MPPKYKIFFKIKDNFASVRLRPKEKHFLAVLVKMTPVPERLNKDIYKLLDELQAQQAVYEVTDVFTKRKTPNEISPEAHDLHAWLMLWAGREDELTPVQDT